MIVAGTEHEEAREAKRQLLSSCRMIRNGHMNAGHAQLKVAEVCPMLTLSLSLSVT